VVRRTSICSLVMVVSLLGFLAPQSTDLAAEDAAQEKLSRPPLIPEPPTPTPVQPPGGVAPAGRGAPPPQASAGPVEELKGIKVVNFTSHQAIFSAAPSEIVAGDPGKVWASSDGNFPQEFVLELPAEAIISHVVFNNPPHQDAKRSSKDVEISVSTQHASFGFEVAAKAVLQQGAIGQGIELKPARQARWIKIRILSNYGSPDRTSLGMLQVLGRPSGR
jgi:F5/8 type C domain-containing protein